MSKGSASFARSLAIFCFFFLFGRVLSQPCSLNKTVLLSDTVVAGVTTLRLQHNFQDSNVHYTVSVASGTRVSASIIVSGATQSFLDTTTGVDLGLATSSDLVFSVVCDEDGDSYAVFLLKEAGRYSIFRSLSLLHLFS